MIELKKFRNGRLKERTLPLYKGKNSGTRVGEKSDLIKCPDEMKLKIRTRYSEFFLNLIPMESIDFVYDLTSFLIEQNILKTYKSFRTRVDNELIHGSEFFTSDVLQDKEVSHFFSDDIVEKRALFMKRFHNEDI